MFRAQIANMIVMLGDNFVASLLKSFNDLAALLLISFKELLDRSVKKDLRQSSDASRYERSYGIRVKRRN